MLFFAPARLIFFAIPKTGTTAIETRLRPMADLAISRPRGKHITPRRADETGLLKAIETTFDTRPDRMAVMRDPIDRLGSWFRFRQRAALRGRPQSTKGLTFAQFAEAWLSDPQPDPAARIVPQMDFVRDGTGRVHLTHLFAYEHPEAWETFLSVRLARDLRFSRANVSATVPLALPDNLRRALEIALADEIALHRRLLDEGGLDLTADPLPPGLGS